jgi:hypothetical protein
MDKFCNLVLEICDFFMQLCNHEEGSFNKAPPAVPQNGPAVSLGKGDKSE